MKSLAVLVTTFCCLHVQVAHAQSFTVPVESAFDSDADGWTGNGNFATDDGNPGGYMTYPGSTGVAAPSDILAPSKFLGDWSVLDGVGLIEFDHRIFEVGTAVVEFFPYSIGLSGPGGAARWSGPTPTGPTEWLTFQVPVREQNWTVTSGTWAGLLGNVTSLLLRIELVSNSAGADHDGIDNVRISAVPEPGAILMLTSGFFGLQAYGWRRLPRSRRNSFLSR